MYLFNDGEENDLQSIDQNVILYQINDQPHNNKNYLNNIRLNFPSETQQRIQMFIACLIIFFLIYIFYII